MLHICDIQRNITVGRIIQCVSLLSLFYVNLAQPHVFVVAVMTYLVVDEQLGVAGRERRNEHTRGDC